MTEGLGWGAAAIANSIAYLSELLVPKAIVLGLTRRSLMQHSLAYALWGEGGNKPERLFNLVAILGIYGTRFRSSTNLAHE